MEMEFVRHEPCYDRILFVLTLDRKKMKERILIGEELQVRFRLQGDMDADVLCDTTRPVSYTHLVVTDCFTASNTFKCFLP